MCSFVEAHIELYHRLKESGIRLRAWRLTEAQLAELEAITGQRELMLGYPVVLR